MKNCTNIKDKKRIISAGVDIKTADLRNNNWSFPALLELLGDGNWMIHCTKGLENPITITYKFWDTVIVKHGKDLIDVAVDLICEVYKQDLT